MQTLLSPLFSVLLFVRLSPVSNNHAIPDNLALPPQSTKAASHFSEISHSLNKFNFSKRSASDGLRSERVVTPRLRPSTKDLAPDIASHLKPSETESVNEVPDEVSAATSQITISRPLPPLPDRVLVCVLPSGTQLANGLRHLSTCAILAEDTGRMLLLDPTLSISADFFRLFNPVNEFARIPENHRQRGDRNQTLTIARTMISISP